MADGLESNAAVNIPPAYFASTSSGTAELHTPTNQKHTWKELRWNCLPTCNSFHQSFDPGNQPFQVYLVWYRGHLDTHHNDCELTAHLPTNSKGEQLLELKAVLKTEREREGEESKLTTKKCEVHGWLRINQLGSCKEDKQALRKQSLDHDAISHHVCYLTVGQDGSR